MTQQTQTRIQVHVVGGPQDGRTTHVDAPAGKAKTRTVDIDGVEHRLVPGTHKMTWENDAAPVKMTLAIHPDALRLYVESA